MRADGKEQHQATAGNARRQKSSASCRAPTCCRRSRASPAKFPIRPPTTTTFATASSMRWRRTTGVRSASSVIVRDGIVHLSGVITDERSRQAAIVAAENVAGVKKVHDHLCWVETDVRDVPELPGRRRAGKGELRRALPCRLRYSIDFTLVRRLFQKPPMTFRTPHRAHECRCGSLV